ncbi:MAG: hypothetical protein J7M18_00580 [Candidatus Eremiobacteraeota bacterium]|nr:hypothetical protein [Candidatus Eremiobacteraeota bacterium]
MKGMIRIIAVLTLICFITGIVFTGSASAQLIRVNIKCKIVKVDRPGNRLEIRVHEGDNKNIQYVLMDGRTKFSTGGKELTYEEAWKRFKKGMIIRVKGGYTMDLKIKARYIYW